MKKTRVIVAALTALSFVGVTSATVIVSDSFTRTTGSGDANGNPAGVGNGSSDWGTADNALGGSITADWLAGRNAAATGGAQLVTNGSRGYLYNGVAYTEANVLSAATDPGLTVAFDFRRYDPDIASATNGFVSFGTGYDTTSPFNPFEVTGKSNFAVLFQQAANGNTGNMSVFVDGVLEGNFDYGDPLAEHSVLLAFTPAVAGNYTGTIDYSVSVDGSSITSGSFTGNAEFGDLAFATNLFTAAYVDNLVVTAVPEPGSLALVGVGGLAMLRRRG